MKDSARSWSFAIASAVRRRLGATDDPRPLAVLRIGLGLLTMVHVGILWPLAGFLFGDDGVLPPAEVCGSVPGTLSLLCHLPGSAVPAFFVGFELVALAMVLGVATRVAVVLTMVGFSAFVLRNPVYAAGDQVFWNFLFLLCWSRCGEVWSVDAWWRARRRGDEGRPRAIPGWPRMLMIVQLCVLFGANGWNKHGPGWTDGNAFAGMLMIDRWYRVPMWGLVTYAEPLMRVASWVVWWFERLFPLVGLAAAARAVLEAHDEAHDDTGRAAPSRAGRIVRWMLRHPLGPGPWLGLTGLFMGTLMVLLNLGWFVPATLVVGVCLLPRLPGTAPWPASERPPSPSSRGVRGWRVAIVTLMGWHAVAMVQGSVPALTEATPRWLARPLRQWRTVTQTQQPWRMFTGGAPRESRYLQAVGLSSTGEPTPIASPLDWHVEPRRPYVGHERRRKVAARILQVPRWQQRYARWLCRTARAPDGSTFEAVALERVVQPLPSSRWMAEHGPLDPYERFADLETTRRMLEHDCTGVDRVRARSGPRRGPSR